MKRKYKVVFGPSVNVGGEGNYKPFWLEIKYPSQKVPLGVWISDRYGAYIAPTKHDLEYVTALLEICPEIIERAFLTPVAQLDGVERVWECLTIKIS